MKPIHVVVMIVLALIVVSALSAVMIGVESPLTSILSNSSETQTGVSQCLDQNPDYSYQDCLREVENS